MTAVPVRVGVKPEYPSCYYRYTPEIGTLALCAGSHKEPMAHPVDRADEKANKPAS
jgi:hypothetical protein